MRILFVTGEYPPMQGGVADYTEALGRALAAGGHQVAVLTSARARGSEPESALVVWPEVTHWGRECWAPLDEAVSRWRPDVVHIQYQTAAYDMRPGINLWPWRPWRRPAVLTAVTFHDLRQPYLFPKAQVVRRWVTVTLARGCRLAITTNPEDTAALHEVRADLVEIPIGSNIPCATPAHFDRALWRQRWGLAPAAAVLCYFGFLNASKGGELLVDVLAALVARGLDAHLLMIGGSVGASDPTNQAYLAQVEQRIEREGLPGRVHWTGHLAAPEVSAAFEASDLCLLPYQDGVSYRRGSFMAALAHGMPIVSTWPSVPYPDLHDGETLLLAPARDADAMTAACLNVLADQDLRQRLGESARRLAERFTWESIAARSLAAYSAAGASSLGEAG